MIGVPNFMTFWPMVPEILIFLLGRSSDDVTSMGKLLDLTNLTARRSYNEREFYFNLFVGSEKSLAY